MSKYEILENEVKALMEKIDNDLTLAYFDAEYWEDKNEDNWEKIMVCENINNIMDTYETRTNLDIAYNVYEYSQTQLTNKQYELNRLEKISNNLQDTLETLQELTTENLIGNI